MANGDLVIASEELVTKIQSGETDLIPTLWEQVERLIRLLASRFFFNYRERCVSIGVELDDLYQQGYFALLVAVAAYDASKGYKFTTYLTYNLKNEFFSIAKMRSAGWYKKKEPLSLETPVGMSKDGNSASLSDFLSDPTAEVEIENVIEREYTERLKSDLFEAMGDLSETQYQLIEQVYFNGLTHNQAAETIGVKRTQELHDSALKTLARNKMLRAYKRNEIISRYGQGFGFRTFDSKRMSPQERAILELEKRGLL